MNMSTISVSERIEDASPRIKARIAGVLYLIMIAASSTRERWNIQSKPTAGANLKEPIMNPRKASRRLP